MTSFFNQNIKPMLAHVGKPFSNKDWIFELKFDGTRCICFFDPKKKIRMQNRRMRNITYRYPELINGLKKAFKNKVILDGEITIFFKGRPSFSKLMTREQQTNPMKIRFLSKKIPATYIVFDILFKNGKKLINLPLMKRKKILKQTMKENENIVFCDYIEEKGKEFFRIASKRKLEGVMAKKKDSVYEIGVRSHSWLKFKRKKSVDCVVGGYTKGEKKRKEYFGSLFLGLYKKKNRKKELIYVGNVGTGFSNIQLRDLKKEFDKKKTKKCFFSEKPLIKEETWLKPYFVIEVEFQQVTKDFKLRAPVFKSLRKDKEASECSFDQILEQK